MTTRAVFLSLAFLAGCATAAPEPAPGTSGTGAYGSAPDTTESPATSAGPSDWALAIVGTPFVFAFRTVVCAATAVVAGPTAGLLAFSDEREVGLAYVRDGLAQNCGPPYAVSVPVAAGYRAEPDVPGSPEPDLDQPRSLTPYSSTALVFP